MKQLIILSAMACTLSLHADDMINQMSKPVEQKDNRPPSNLSIEVEQGIQGQQGLKAPTSNTQTYDYSAEQKNDGRQTGDIQLMRAVQNSIRNSYRNYNLNVHVSAGVVTLSGIVNTDKDKDAIGEKISELPGVIGVNNQLKVSGQ